MLALLYLLFAFFIGHYCLLKCTPWFRVQDLRANVLQSSEGRQLPAWLFQLPMAWLVGALILNWSSFLISNVQRSISGTLAVLVLAGAASVWIFLSEKKKADSAVFKSWRSMGQGTGKAEIFYLVLALLLAAYTNLHTLGQTLEQLRISNGVFSDFAPHISMIRSFSVGENFPPQYPHFAAGDMPYHFLFHFMAASLESLGLSLALSFNLLSILSLLSLLLLFYVLSVQISGLRAVAILAMLLIFFRSSFAFFDFAQSYGLAQLPQAIMEVDFYAGKTNNASWGMWTLFNTFANQRHLAFGLAALIGSLILTLPLVLARSRASAAENQGQMWRIESWGRAIFIGVFLGATAFWNGAALMAALMVLAGFGLASRHRLEYLVIAVLAVVLAQIQSAAFLAAGKSPVSATFIFGFLAEPRTLGGAISYVLQAFGLMLPLFIAAVIYFRRHALIWLAFALPMIFAFTVQPTMEMALNHKFVLVSLFLMGIAVLWMLLDMWQNKPKIWRVAIVPVLGLLYITGTIDTAAFHNINNGKYGIQKQNPITEWVMANTKPQSIFLTDLVTINQVLYAGRLSYLGWPYYGWSAGYDTSGREADIRLIYGASTQEDLRKAMLNKKVDYILVNDSVRHVTNYVVNEYLIADTYPLVFESAVEDTKIYKVTPGQ